MDLSSSFCEFRPISAPAPKALGHAIRTRRKELGISQEALAERSGLHRTYVGGVERGTRNPALVNIVVLANALDLTAGDLLTQAKL